MLGLVLNLACENEFYLPFARGDKNFFFNIVTLFYD